MPEPDLLSSLQPPTLQSVMAPLDTLGQVGVGLAGMGRERNPFLVQAQDQFQQQVELMRLQHEVNRQRQEALKLNLQMNHEMLEAAHDPSVLDTLAQQRLMLFNQSGFNVPPGMAKAWATKQYTKEQEKQFVMSFLGREQDPQAVQNVAQQFGLPPDRARYYQQLSMNERFLKAENLPTRLSMQNEIADTQKKKTEAWLALHPQFKDSGNLHGMSGYAEGFVEKNYSRSLYDLTQQNPDDVKILLAASDYARKLAQSEFQRGKQEESDIIKQREIDVATVKSKLKSLEPKPMSQRERTLVFKPFDITETAMADLEAMKSAATRLHDQGYLATNTSFLAQKYAQGITWWSKSGDPDVLLLKQLTAPVTIGLVDRGLHDERGTRAMQMFHEQIRIVSQFPTLEGYQRLFGYYEYLFGRIAAKQLRRIESQIGKVPDDVVEEAQRTFLDIFPKGLPPNPSRPLGAPKGYQGP